LLNLPFRKKQFDIIFSLGVLHHTPDPREAFTNLSACLREQGIISLWVYGTAGKFSDFKTNPLRGERRKYVKNDVTKGIYWLVVTIREVLSNTIRLVTTRMYLPFLYLLCYPLAALGKVPLLKYLTASVHRNWRVRLQENFDWFSPQYQSHHTKEEVAGWFDAVKLNTLSVLKHGFIPKVGLKGKKR
jgi:SAM-dependent methyltransferase